MKKTMILCDRCEAVISDQRSSAQITFGKSGRKSGLNPLDLCASCKDGFQKWLNGGR